MIIALVGASGAGKTTIARALLCLDSDIRMIESVTTRSPRSSDIPGEYEYISQERFDAHARAGHFEWTVAVHGYSYGTLKSSLERAFLPENRRIMILVPDAARKLWNYAGQDSKKVTLFYLKGVPPHVLRERIIGRGDDVATAQKRVEECIGWDEEAVASQLPYYFVCNGGKPRDAACWIRSLL